MRDQVVATTRELVRLGANPGKVLDRCREVLADAGLRCTVVEGDEGDALLAERGGSPRLVLAGHVDTVPVVTGWEVDPRGGVLREGAVWGRGSADMLGAVACFLTLVQERPDLDLAVALTTDEESGMEGARALVASGLLHDVEAVVLGEPTGLALGAAHRGVLWLDLELEGRAAHASMPEEGENAIRRLAEALQRLDDVELPGPAGLLPGTTLEPTMVEGGEARNQVPNRVRLALDCRFPPPATPHDLAGRLDRALLDLPHVLTVAFDLPPFQGDPGGRLARVAGDALHAEGMPRDPVGLPFGTEAGRYGRLGLDQVILGPGKPALAHTSEERVGIRSLTRATAIYERIAEAYQGPRRDGGP